MYIPAMVYFKLLCLSIGGFGVLVYFIYYKMRKPKQSEYMACWKKEVMGFEFDDIKGG